MTAAGTGAFRAGVAGEFQFAVSSGEKQGFGRGASMRGPRFGEAATAPTAGVAVERVNEIEFA